MGWNLEEALTYYRRMGAPGDQNALIGLLREIQQEHGGSSQSAPTGGKNAIFEGTGKSGAASGCFGCGPSVRDPCKV